MSDKAYEITQYLQKHNGVNAKEVADALGMEKRLVDAYFSAGIAQLGYGYRDTTVTPSVLVLNEKGLAFKQ